MRHSFLFNNRSRVKKNNRPPLAFAPCPTHTNNRLVVPTVNTQINLWHKHSVQSALLVGSGAQNTEKQPSRNSAHITAAASCRRKATHVGKVRNSNIVQVPGETTAAGSTPQKTGNRAAVVLHRPPGGETQQQRSQETEQVNPPVRKACWEKHMKKLRRLFTNQHQCSERLKGYSSLLLNLMLLPPVLLSH